MPRTVEITLTPKEAADSAAYTAAAIRAAGLTSTDQIAHCRVVRRSIDARRHTSGIRGVRINMAVELWLDTEGRPINAHGGGILYHEGRYYWYGEHRPERGFSTEVGITCYSSDDLIHWKYESVALPVSEESGSDIERGCIMERPKVIFNPKTRKFVLWFHLELKGLHDITVRRDRHIIDVRIKLHGKCSFAVR